MLPKHRNRFGVVTTNFDDSNSDDDFMNHEHRKMTGQYEEYSLVEKVYPTLRDLQRSYSHHVRSDLSKWQFTKEDSMEKLKSLFPIATWVKEYNKDWLKKDISAGLTVAILLVPQSMAYAQLAGLPEVYGLYAATIPLLIFALMSTSTQLRIQSE